MNAWLARSYGLRKNQAQEDSFVFQVLRFVIPILSRSRFSSIHPFCCTATTTPCFFAIFSMVLRLKITSGFSLELSPARQDNQWAILFVFSCPNLHSFLASFTYSSIWGHVKLNRTFVHVCHKMKWVAVGSSLLDNEPLKRHDFLFIVGGKTLGWKP